MKKLGVVSFKYEAKEFDKQLKATAKYKKESWSDIDSYARRFNSRRLAEMKEIKDHAEKNEVTHLLFPGKTLAITYRIWDDCSIDQILKEIAKLFQNSSLILEAMYSDSKKPQENPPVDTGIVSFEKGKEVGERVQQIFATSNGQPAYYKKILYKRFWAENLWGHRIRKIDGITFLIWVCGEINFLKSPNHGRQKPVPQVNFDDNIQKQLESMPFDVFFNPAHTPMGEIHIVKHKLKYLSKLGKVAIHTTNLPKFQKGTDSSMYCYINGKEFNYSEKSKWPHETSWVMETVKI
jgi:hypothetical protein